MSPTDPQENKRLVQQRFARFADGYVTSQTHAKAPEFDLILALAGAQAHWTVLDIATGGGHTALVFLPHVRQVIASDLTGSMLRSARQHIQNTAGERAASVAFHQVDAEALAYQEGSLDLVTCRIAPHHFSDVPAFLSECTRVLRPGGLLLLQDHLLPDDPQACETINRFERLRDPSHQRGFSGAEWLALFAGAGLQVERTEKIMKKHAFLPFVQRQGCTPEVVAELAGMLGEAPEAVRQWRDPQGFDGDLAEAYFFDWHILIAGRKP